MATFYPDSEIYLLKEIPFSPDYRNTGLFASRAQQELLFRQKAFYHAAQCTYVRETGRFKLEIPIAVAYQCNYIMFKNTAFQDKWFYAFCTGVAYVNNVTSEFTFTLDIMQTWAFDYILKPCFIERQHVENDALGANLIPEGLEIGEMIYATSTKIPATYGKIYVAATFDKNLNNFPGGMSNNVYYGVCINEFNTAAEVNAFINAATSANKLSGIVSIFQAINYNTRSTFTVNQVRNDLFEGYKPRNNKLYSYPYSFLQVLGNDGGNAIFRWEYFKNFGQGHFQIDVTPSLSSQMLITPTDYKGKDGYNPAERMIIENVMLCSWNGDTYKANLAQTIGKYMVPAQVALVTGAGLIDKAKTAIPQMLGATPVTATPAGKTQNGMTVYRYEPITQQPQQQQQQETSLQQQAIGFSKEILNTIQTALAAVYSPDAMARQAQNPGASTDILYMNQEKAPYFINMGISAYYAKLIDQYFDMYGYAINQIRTPNRLARALHTYVKTAGCIAEGALPASMIQAIEDIYNNGVDFWYITGQGLNTFNNVGNYTYGNDPIMG